MPYCYGVTLAEVSFNDAERWPAVLGQLTGADRLDEAGFSTALRKLGLESTDGRESRFWTWACGELFGIGEQEASGITLDSSQSYALFLAAGMSAKLLDERLAANGAPASHYKLYWNVTRMGGREPTELPRPITLDDAFEALGVDGRATNEQVADQLRSFEEAHAIRLPEALKVFFCREGIGIAVCDCHPNNPNLVSVEGWELMRELRLEGLSGDLAITMMLPHQGDHEWVAVFDDGDSDAHIYVRWGVEGDQDWRLTAPTVGMFFWDLAQTGLAWHRETGFEPGPQIRNTDIGLAVIR
jgi:hypothetical protein